MDKKQTNQPHEDFYFNAIFEDFVNYGNDMKASIVFRKCIRAKKFILADKIKRKYRLESSYSDMVIATGMALIAKDTPPFIPAHLSKPPLTINECYKKED